MAAVVIVGDGPAGLSAALFLAKREQQVTLFGTDQTPMHEAKLFNYLGIEVITGSDLVTIGRAQAAGFGAELRSGEVTSVTADANGFTVTTADGQQASGKYLILANGRGDKLAASLGAGLDEEGAPQVDQDYRTSVDRLYAVGRIVRRHKTEAIISAGDGAAAALDILSAEAGKNVHDFDVVE